MSFEDFKKSFSYGQRSDLNFKFLAQMTDLEAQDFMEDFFDAFERFIDKGQSQDLMDVFLKGQRSVYNKATSFSFEEDLPSKVIEDLSEKKLGLMTSSGHFLEDPEPFGIKNMNQEEAEKHIYKFLKEAPQLSIIPSHVDISALKVRHGGYDIRGALEDAGVSFPLEGLRKLASHGSIKLSKESFSFVGACAQGRLKSVLGDWVEIIKKNQIQVMVLVPVWPVCHVSVGHIARRLEAEGIQTLVIATFSYESVLRSMKLPRVLCTPFPMGRPMGRPGDFEMQLEVLKAGLALFSKEAPVLKVLDDINYKFKAKSPWF